MIGDELGQADLRSVPERLPDAAAQRLRIHVDLLEQRGRVGFLVGGPHVLAVDARLAHRGVQRALHGQPDGRGGGVEVHGYRDGFLVAELQRAGFDAAQDVDHPAVLEPHLVIEEPPELFGQLAHRRLRPLGRVEPVIVNMPQPRILPGDFRQLVHAVQQPAQLLLPCLRQQEIVERLEGLALVRAGDGLPAAEDVIEQFALAAVPAGDLLAQLPVQLPEVLLHLAEVSEQLPGGRGELLVAVADRASVEQVELAGLDPGDLVVYLLALPEQLGDPLLRVGLGAEDDLP